MNVFPSTSHAAHIQPSAEPEPSSFRTISSGKSDGAPPSQTHSPEKFAFPPQPLNIVNIINAHSKTDISAWFIKRIVGIQLNPEKNNVNTLKIKPSFIDALNYASAYHDAPSGRTEVSRKREGQSIILDVRILKDICARAELEPPFCFEDEQTSKTVVSGTYKIVRT